ncbi:MerR family transcriptional regulator [Bifidobacterium avesanii]|uniref:MerR family transcriptional regulator n=1 Tax=Bifidobacterium avesanii TaxID=1798157 RepID=A0A7K3TGT1_9BIFI|nr:MerR family transcriptional regulator [Bifidobacterium avesanii]KAB8295467.1 transcriptional regulator [Bifidobacterium avesanii]NEG77473.1 MerR family transcriptional regulator [Bifidobacterium avesanii]
MVELTLHRGTDAHTADMVQGELFATADEEQFRRGYRGTVASKVAGITYRQLDYWARKRIVEPSIKSSHGSGSRRLYSFKDVVILAVSKRLLDAGVNLQNVTAAIGFLTQRTSKQLENITIMCDGDEVHECTTNEQVIALVRSGRAVFGVSVGSLWHQIDEALEHEDYVDLTNMPVDVGSGARGLGRPIDDLTAARLRMQLEARKAERAREAENG